MEPERHAENRNWIESILRHIPGFRGYLEKEYRRESDHMARVWLADRLHGTKQPIDNYFRRLLDAGDLDAMPMLDRIRTQMDRTINKMRGDVRGYSGFFDYVRVDESVLDQVYEHDMSLIQDVDHFAQAVERLSESSKASEKDADQLLQQLVAIDQQYRKRVDILKGVADN